MIDRDTRFAREALKLKPPSSKDFNKEDWERVYRDGEITSEDEKLFEAACWIGEEVAAAYEHFPNSALSSLSPQWSTILAVASLNREYRQAEELVKEQTKKDGDQDFYAVDAEFSREFIDANKNKFTISGVAETGIDSTENWLFDASKSKGNTNPDNLDLAAIAIEATRFYSFRKSMSGLWNDVRFQGWFVQQTKDQDFIWRPGDEERERLRFAWKVRNESNLLNFPSIDCSVWPKLTPVARRKRARKFSVVAVSTKRNQPRLKTGSVSYLSKRMPIYMWEKGMLEGCYVSDFIESPMPKNPNLSVVLLQKAWHVLLDTALLLSRQASLPEVFDTRTIKECSLAIERDELVAAMLRALDVSATIAEEIVEFLTFEFQSGGTAKSAGNKGLWAAPLVPVPNSSEVLLALPVLATSYPARRAEAWLEKGGIDDSNPSGARGDRYETIVRDGFANAIDQNKTFETAKCSKRGVKKTDSFGEQIDVLISFGSLCLVGEVKFLLMPTDAHEVARYEKKLFNAANQVKRKAAAIQSRLDVLTSALEIDQSAASTLTMLPVVITNQGYGFSDNIEGVYVVEASFLKNYLSSGEVVTGMAQATAGGRSITKSDTQYSSEVAAANSFRNEIAKPNVLTRFFNRVRFSTIEIPTLVHGTGKVMIPRLDDISGYERMQAEALVSRLI